MEISRTFHNMPLFLSFILMLFGTSTVYALRISDVKEFQDVARLDNGTPVSCDDNLAFGGQRSRLLDSQVKVQRYMASLPRDLAQVFGPIVKSNSHNVSIFTDQELTNLLKHLKDAMTPLELQTSLQPRQVLASGSPDDIASMLKKWTPAFRLLQTPESMCKTNEMIPLDAFGHLCQHLSSFDTTVKEMSLMEDRCAHCTAYFVNSRHKREMMNVLDDGKGRVLYKLIRQTYPQDWDIHMMTLDPSAVRVKDVARVNPTHFSDNSQLQVLMDEKVWRSLDKRVMAVLGEALMTSLGPLSGWSPKNMTDLGQFVMALSPERLDEILTPQLFFDPNLDLLDLPMANKFFSAGVWKVIDYFEDSDKKSEFDSLPGKKKLICLILRFAPMKSLFDTLITVDMTKKAMMGCMMDPDMDRNKLMFLLKKLVYQPNFDWSSKSLLEIDPLMPLLPSSLLENITDKNLMDYWSRKHAVFDFPLTKAIMKRLQDSFNFDQFKCQEMEILQEGLLTLSGKELDMIPLPVFSECAKSYLPYLGDNCHYNPRVCEHIWKKIKQSSQKTRIPILELMANMTDAFVEEFVPTRDLSGIELEEGSNPDDLMALDDLPMDGVRAKIMYRKVKEKYGNISHQFDGRPGRKDGLKLFGKGATVDDLEALPEDGSLMNVLPEIVSDVGKDSRKKLHVQSSVVYDKLHDILGMGDRANDDVCIEDGVMEDVAGFFTQASEKDLGKLRPESKKDILRSIGQREDYVSQMSRPKLRTFFKMQYNATGLKGSDKISPEDMEKAGPRLFCGMTKDEVAKLSEESLKSYISLFGECEQLGQETRMEIAAKYEEAMGGLKEMLKSPSKVKDMGSLMPFLNVAGDLTQKEKEKLKFLSDQVQENLKERQERLSRRSNNDIPDEEKDAEKSQRSKFNKKLMRITSDDTEGIECSSLRPFEGALEFLETGEIRRMEQSEFVDCLEEFHMALWDDSQLKELGMKLKGVFGKDTSRWTANITMRVGPLLEAFGSEDIEKMEFSTDALAYLGLFKMGSKKSSSILHKLMEDQVIENVTDIDADLLGSLGSLVCGFMPDKIALMNSTMVRQASPHFSEVDCLDEDQMEALMGKLEEELGSDWSDVQPDVIEELGMLMGGASEAILSSLGKDQLASVDGKALEHIPPKKFAKAFTADKLQQLSDEQAMHLQPDHVWRMDRRQRQAMENFTKNAGFDVPKAKHVGKRNPPSREFQKGHNLPRSSCGSSLSFAGQRDDLLDSPKKVTAFEKTLKGDMLDFFKEVIASQDHSIDQFTADELRTTLEFLVESVDQEDREDFVSILDNFEYISSESLREMLEEWPPTIHLLQKPEVMCEVTSRLDQDLLQTFCNRVINEDVTAAVTTEVLERCADCAVLRFVDRENYRHMPPLEDAKASVFMRKLRQMDMPDWDLNTLAFAPRALEPKDVDRIRDLSHFKNESNLEIFADDDVSCCLDDGVKRKIAGKLQEALGPLSTWSDDVIEKVGSFIAFLPDSDLEKELTGDFVMKNLRYIEPDMESNPEEKKMLTTAALSLAKHLSRNSERVTKSDKMKAFCLLAKFPPKQDVFDTIYNTDDIREGLQNCSDWKIDREMSVRALSKISRSLNKTWQNEDLRMLHDFPSGTTPQIIDDIDRDVLLEKWDEVKEADFSTTVLRSAWNKLKSNFTVSTLTCDQVKDMGRLFLALSLKEMEKVPDATLADCLEHVSKMVGRVCREDKKICDKMWEKVDRLTRKDKDRNKPDIIRALDPDFFKFVPSKDLKNLTLEDLGGIDKIGKMDLDESQAEEVMKIVEKEKGPVSKDNRNYTGHHIGKLGSTFFKGASAESVENLPEGTELIDSLPAMRKNMKDMNDGKVDAVYGKLRDMFGITTNDDVCLDEATIKKSAGFFSKASGDDLKKLDDKTRKSVLSEIGRDEDVVKDMPREKLREQFKVLKETENFEGKNKIEDDDIEKYGSMLLCAMEKADVDKLSETTVKARVSQLADCDQLGQDTRKEIAKKYISANNGMDELLKKPDKLKAFGNLLLNADLPDPSSITKEQKEVLGSIVGDVMTEVNKRRDRLTERSNDDIPASEKTEDQVLRGDLARKLWETVSDDVDCPTIQSFEGDLNFMTVSDVEGLQPEVVTECLTEFQEVDWDKDQMKTFGDKIKKSFGNDTGRWSKDRVMRTGKLLSGLGSEDIDKMVIDEDVVAVIGQREVAEPKKMFKKFKEDAGISNMSSVDSDMLRGLGKMLCGMEPKDMKDLKKDVVKGVISDLGDIDCLDDDQLKVISQTYQDAITEQELSQMDMKNLGFIAGGLDEEKLKKLSGEQLGSIPPSAIKKMKPDTIANAFTSDKMSQMTMDQMTALDPKVLRNLKVSQLIALENVAKGRKNVNATQEAKNRTERFFIELPKNVSVKSLDAFKEVRSLSPDSCGGMSFAGQKDNLLDTPSKQSDFNASLPTPQAVMFHRIATSPDHDVSQFTTFEMRNVLKLLTQELDEDQQDTFIDLKTQFAHLGPDALNATLRASPPSLYLLMKPQLMCSTFGQMDVDSLETFCERLTFPDVTTATFINVLDRCGDCLAVAHAHRTDLDMMGLLRGFKGKAFYDKLRQWKPKGWDVYHLVFAPDALEVKDIARITDLDHFKDIQQIARLADPRFYEKAPKSVMQAIARRFHTALGPFSHWSFLESNILLPYILNFPPKILEQEMKVTMVLSILSKMDDLLDVAGDKFLSISAWKITDYLIKNAKSVPRDIKKQAFCMVLKYANHKKLWTKVYSTSEVYDCLADCGVYHIPEKTIFDLIRRLVRKRSFQWDQETFDVLGPFMAAVPVYKIKQADPDLLYDNWDLISNLDFKFGKLRRLWRMVESKVDLKSLTCKDIKHLGRALLVLHSKDIKKIPDESIGECSVYIGDLLQDSCRDRKVLCKTLWKKLKEYAKDKTLSMGAIIKDLGKDFLQYIPRGDIETVEIGDLGGVDSLASLEPSPNQAPILMRKVKEELGPVTMSNSNYSSEAVMKMGPIFYHGASGSEFEILPEDSSLLEMLPHMAQYFKNINEKKIEVIFKKLKKIFAVDASDNICLDRALTEQIAMFFTAARAEDLAKFSDATKKVILQTLGGKYEYVARMSRAKVQELFSALMDIDSLGSKKLYEAQDVGDYGYMWCGHKASQATRLSQEAVDNHMSLLKDCVHLEPETRSGLVKRSISLSGSLSDMLTSNPKRLEDLGSMIIDINVDLLKGLDQGSQEIFVSSTQKLMESVTGVQNEAKGRPSAEISSDEKQKDAGKLKKVGRALLNMAISLYGNEKKRRRRSTTPVDCPTIRSFNGALSFLSPEEIVAMETSEFQDCLAEFQDTEWDDGQLAAFQGQLEATFGADTSTWSQEDVLASGALLDSLDPNQITNLTVLDDDTISSLGSNVFTNHAPLLMTTYLTSQNMTDLSMVDSDTLGNVGNLVCGLDTSQMQGMESSAIDDASSELSSVSCLDSNQLTTLGNKIVEIRGTDWASATSDEISSLGVLAGGLPASVLEDIGSDQLSSLSPQAVENMSPETFANVFTADKINSLSSAQANSLTDDQRAQLSDDQLTAVNYVATTASDTENGAPERSSNLVVAFTLVVITVLVQQ